jgi:hypothetical protein
MGRPARWKSSNIAIPGAEARACSDYTALGLCGGQLNGSRSRSVEKPGGNLWRLKDAEPEA